jgi:ribonuclease BN (tRNA processing enzyme)
VDAGAGSSLEFGRSDAKLEDLQGILLNHLHVDHNTVLPRYIKSSYFTSKSADIGLYGPAANNLMLPTNDNLRRLLGDKGAFTYLKSHVDKRARASYKIVVIDAPLLEGKTSTYVLGYDITAKATFVHHGPVAAVA